MNRVSNQNVWIESEAIMANTTEWSIPLRLVRAVADGTTADLDRVSPLLAGNLEKIRDMYAEWIRGHKVPLNFEVSSNLPAAADGVSLFFSGGVDSFYSLIKHRDEIDNLVLIHGFDVPLADTKTFALAKEQARDVAQLFGKRLIVVRTNLHWEQPSVPGGWGMYFGAALASVALSLAPIHRKIFVASSYSYAHVHPWGSHPMLDPLWSTENVRIVYDIGETRMEKLRVLVQHPDALSRLRVCWENLGNYNCGLCEKCIRTMLGLRALGAYPCVAFPDTLTLGIVRQQGLSHSASLLWRELLDAGLPPELDAAVLSAIHSYDSGLPPRTGTCKREVKRWLCAIRNSWNVLLSPIEHYRKNVI